MSQMILGVFANRASAEEAIIKLENEGFNPKDISIIMRDADEANTVVNNTGANVAGGAASGVATGAVVGGLAGLLIGIGAIAIPGIGALLIGGPIAAALGLTGAAAATTSGAVTGALAGGLVGSLVGLGVPQQEAQVYEERVKAGAILVAVPTLNRHADDVRAILEKHGAEQVRTVGSADVT